MRYIKIKANDRVRIIPTGRVGTILRVVLQSLRPYAVVVEDGQPINEYNYLLTELERLI